MNENQQMELQLMETPPPAIAATNNTPPALMGSVWMDKQAFEHALRVSTMLSKSSIVPSAYQGKPQDCFIAMDMAQRMGLSPVFVMQNLYVIKGRPSWAGQACMALIKASGQFDSVQLNYTGKRGTDDRGCYVSARRVSDGKTVEGTEVTLSMAKAEGWTSNLKWRTMTEQMLGYRAAAFFARLHCPEALMGMQTADEVDDITVQSAEASVLTEALKEAKPDDCAI